MKYKSLSKWILIILLIFGVLMVITANVFLEGMVAIMIMILGFVMLSSLMIYLYWQEKRRLERQD